MILVKLTKDLTAHGLFAGDEAGLDDSLAERLIKQNRARKIGESAQVEKPAEPMPEPVVMAEVEQEEGTPPWMSGGDEDLELMTKEELLTLAEERGVKADRAMRKADIIEAIQA